MLTAEPGLPTRASASVAVSTVAGTARLAAAASPKRENILRREIASNPIFSLIYDLLLGCENRASSWPSVSVGQLMNLMANRERAVSSLGTGRCPLGQFRNFARCAEIVRRETIAESPSAYRSDASRVSELRAMAQAGRVRIMKSPVAKRSVVINGHKTSVSLEDAFWSAAKEIAAERGLTLSELIAMVDHDRGERGNLSSALRLFVLARYRGEPALAGSQQQEPPHREAKPATP
jgi:predicted DNA-binding ribbon-helix-helix protein